MYRYGTSTGAQSYSRYGSVFSSRSVRKTIIIVQRYTSRRYLYVEHRVCRNVSWGSAYAVNLFLAGAYEPRRSLEPPLSRGCCCCNTCTIWSNPAICADKPDTICAFKITTLRLRHTSRNPCQDFAAQFAVAGATIHRSRQDGCGQQRDACDEKPSSYYEKCCPQGNLFSPTVSILASRGLLE